MRALTGAVLVAFGLLTPPAGGAPGPPVQQQQPSFRVSTDVVVIDVAALDNRGAPVKDLRLEDFVVRVDGQPRQIRSALFVDQSPKPRSSADATPTFSSNQSGDTGRLVLLVVDEETIQAGGMRAAAESAGRLFAGLGASDKVGLALLPGPRMPVAFGDDRQRVLDALKRVTGVQIPREDLSLYALGVAEAYQIDRGDEIALTDVMRRECTSGGKNDKDLLACRAQIQRDASWIVRETRREAVGLASDLHALLRALTSIDAPKTLIVFSQGIPSPDALSEMTSLGPASAAARATIHAVRLDRTLFSAEQASVGGSIHEDRDANRRGLEALAGQGRGTVVDAIGSATTPFERLAAEMSGYYLLGLETTAPDRDGKRHRIEVAVVRRGVTVRARPEFVFEAPAVAAKPRDETALMKDALGSPVIATGLPIRLTTFNLADDDPSGVRLLLSAEIDRQQERAGAASVGYVVYDQAGKVIIGFSKQLELARAPSGALRFHSVTPIPAGVYTIRFAAARNDRAGSLEHKFSAGLTRAGSLTLGNLVLTDGRETTALVPPVDGAFTTDAIRGFVQIGAGVPKDASFTLEVAKDDSTPALIGGPLSLGPARNGIQVVSGVLDVGLLPPGDYLARLSLSVDGKPVGALSAPLSLAAAPGSARFAPAAPGGTRAPAVHRAATVPPFDVSEVLSPEVLGPFLDEIATHSANLPKTALDAARAGRFDEALGQMKTGPADPTAAFVRGVALLARKDPQTARAAFQEAIRGTPDSMVGAFYIGACYAVGGRMDQAAAAWQTSLVGLDRYPIVYRVTADALQRAGQAERALVLLDEASAKWPEDEALNRRLAGAELEAGLHDRALAHVEPLIAKHPADTSLVFLALESLYKMGLAAPDSGLPALVTRMEHYTGLYVAANGPRQALVGEWIAYFRRRLSKEL